MSKKILVCGGRDFGEPITTKGEVRSKDLWLPEMLIVKHVIDWFKPNYIIQGFATGADHMARKYADKFNIPHSGEKYKAEWRRPDGSINYSAGPRRNALMISDNPDIDLVVAFSGGVGTANMIKLSKAAGIEVIEPKIIDL